MTQEIEKLKAELLADAVEIDRLKAGYEDLKTFIRNDMFVNESYNEFNKIHNEALRGVLKEINRITGK